MTEAILRVTDGTDVVDLIDPSSGFHLTSWVPQTADYKDGGIFQNPPLADFGQMVVGKWENIEESMILTLSGANPDTAARKLQDLRRLLQKANNYWITDWQNEPVWIEAKAKCETNTRYAIIQKGNLANDQNPYADPFTGTPTTLEDLPFVFLRRHWTSDEPLQHTAIELSAVESFNSSNFGTIDTSFVRDPTTANEVFVANKQNIANLTDIHRFNGVASWSGNIINNTSEVIIIQGTTVGGATYFGINTSVTNSGPFNNIIFDVIIARSGGTIVIEYYNGATWATLSSVDNTSTFSNTGVNGVLWEQPSDWATANLLTLFGGTAPNVTGYWIRFRVTSMLATNPTFIPMMTYSTVWPYVEVQSTVIGGDISALAKHFLSGHSDSLAGQGASRVVMGTRLVSRGSDFRAFINLAIANGQNDANVTVASAFSDAADLRLPVGRSILVDSSTVSGSLTLVAQILINNPLSSSYIGSFKIFVRVMPDSSGDDWTLEGRVRTNTSNPAVLTATTLAENMTANFPFLIDLGVMRVSNRTNSSELGTIEIQIYANNEFSADPGKNLAIVDFAMIPVDEWALDTESPSTNTGVKVDSDDYLRIDNQGKLGVISEEFDKSTNISVSNYNNVINGEVVLPSNERVRLWMVQENGTSSQSRFPNFLSIQSEVNQRYLTLRGDR